MSLLDTASLLLTPNAYKEGKLYSVIPSDGSGDFTFTRATTATRVNSDGLVELVPYNLVSYSEQFDNAAWNKINTTITANDTTAPDNTQTADLVNLTGASGRVITSVSFTAAPYTFSTFVKYASQTDTLLRVFDGTTTFTLTLSWSGGVPSFVSNTGSAYNIQNYGDGWYRVSLTCTTAAAAGTVQIYPNGFNSSGTAYLWGAQLVEGSTALPYQKTETRLNIPRLDYSNGTCPSILLEPQRTNLLLQSSSFDSASWSKGGGSTVVANTTIAPDGTLTADTLNIPNNGNVSQAYNASSNATRILTFYLKADSNVTVKIAFFTPSIVATCNLTTEWQRFEITHTWSGTVYPQIYNDSGSSVSIYAWGAQLEAGSYATSYIPTTTASVTRNADICNKTGISSLIGQTEGTLYFELKDFVEKDIPCITIDDGTNNNRFLLFRELPSGRYSLFVSISGVIYATYSTISANDGKFAIAYNGSGFVVYRNGVQIITSTNAVPNNLSAIRLNGRATNDLYTLKKVYSTALWKTRLTNDQLAQLTSL